MNFAPPLPIPAPMAPNKQQTNLRLTPEARRILDMLSRRWGISQADVMEVLLRQAKGLETAPFRPFSFMDPGGKLKG